MKPKPITVLSARQAGPQLDQLIEETAASHEPITIIGKRSNAVLLAEEDWKAIKESLCQLSIPGMQTSIQKGMKTPIDECTKDVCW
ncbi:MAG: hypothetical protein NPIRA04_32820 [Nitrospirales bacterium]|nr:MAG: hypothetical protein NPIRA04_32820 [Nitrospirales bacterium]